MGFVVWLAVGLAEGKFTGTDPQEEALRCTLEDREIGLFFVGWCGDLRQGGSGCAYRDV